MSSDPTVPVAEPVPPPYPIPPASKTARAIRPGRGSALEGKVAVVTGAARGIGRAIAVEFGANGADGVALDICGPGILGLMKSAALKLDHGRRQCRLECDGFSPKISSPMPVFLASDAAALVTGGAFAVTGGAFAVTGGDAAKFS